MMLTPEQLDELRSLANSAKDGGGNLEWLKAEELAIEWPQWDADFVAALSPDVLLKLLAHIDAQQARIAELEQAIVGEREACALVCESRATPGTGSVAILNGAADAIRARGEKGTSE